LSYLGLKVPWQRIVLRVRSMSIVVEREQVRM